MKPEDDVLADRYSREMSRMRCIRSVSVISMHLLSCIYRDSLPPVCLPHFLTSSPQLRGVPLGALPGFASPQAPRSKAEVRAA